MRRLFYITLISSIIFPFCFSNLHNKTSAKSFPISKQASRLIVPIANLESEYYKEKKESDKVFKMNMKCFKDNEKDSVWTSVTDGLLAYVVRGSSSGPDYFEIWNGCSLYEKFEIGKTYPFTIGGNTCLQHQIEFTYDIEPKLSLNARYIVYYIKNHMGEIKRAVLPAYTHHDSYKLMYWNFKNQC